MQSFQYEISPRHASNVVASGRAYNRILCCIFALCLLSISLSDKIMFTVVAPVPPHYEKTSSSMAESLLPGYQWLKHSTCILFRFQVYA